MKEDAQQEEQTIKVQRCMWIKGEDVTELPKLQKNVIFVINRLSTRTQLCSVNVLMAQKVAADPPLS